MALDASIYGNIQPAQQVNPLANLAQAYQLRGMQARSDAADMELQQQRGLNDAYRGAVGPGGTVDRNALLSSLAGGGYGAAIPSVQKGFAEQDKSGREAEKAKYEAMLKQFEVAGQIMSGVTDQASWDRARALTAQAFGAEKAAQMPAAYNPALIAENQQKAMAVKEQIELRYKAASMGETQRHNQATEAISRGGQEVTMRGQDLQDTRARDFNATQQQQADTAKIGKVSETSTALRKEFEGLPEVKNYKQALPSFKGIEDAVQRNTPMSDINIVYGIAKLYDPNSVVREGEYATVANSPAIPERIKGYAQYLMGGGKLTDEVKRQILTEAKSRMKSYEDEFGKVRSQYQDIAGRSGAEPSLVVNEKFEPALKPAAAAGGGGTAAPRSKAEFDALPSGAVFRAPDGSIRRKP